MRLRFDTGSAARLSTRNTIDQSAMTAEWGGTLGRLWTDSLQPRPARKEDLARGVSHTPRNVAMIAPPEERLMVRASRMGAAGNR